MEPVLFYGVPQGCSFGSIVALEWLGIPYRLSRIEMMERPWPALFARVNSLTLTPSLLTEDNRTINESVAILLHLAARNDNLLGYAQGTHDYDRLNQILAYLNSEFFTAFGPIWAAYEMESNPPVQQMLRDMGFPRVMKACAHLDALLADREWIDGGNKRTVADAYFVGIARWAEYHQVLTTEQYPNLYRHLRKLRSDPAVIFADATEKALPAATTAKCLGPVTLEELESRLPM